MNILQAIDDPKVFSHHFHGGTWDGWRVFLAALFALPMTNEQLAFYQNHTGRTTLPTEPLHEAWLICGRRAGKSFVLAVIAIFLAAFKDWRPQLGPGEVATIMIIAADRRQARVIMRYCLGLLKSVPMLAQLIKGETRETISLHNRVVLEIHTASFRSTRGYTVVAALLDEIGYWPVDEHSSAPDIEVLNAIKPCMATITDAMLLCASSPHARKGALWRAYTKHYGKDGDPVLVWQAPTRDMNATVPQTYIDSHLVEDPARAAAEYMAQFRSDLEAFIQREIVEACTGGFFELSPSLSKSYYAAVDPAGGSGSDAFALAISHREREHIIIDCVRERKPPFSPSEVIDEFVPLLKSYRISKVVGDRWAGGFPPEQFQKRGIRYEQSQKVKSDLYRDLLPLLNSGRVVLPRNDKLTAQLVSLERHVARGGHDTIDHPRDQHDDVANAVAGAAVLAATSAGYDVFSPEWAAAWGDAGDLDAPALQEPSSTQHWYYELLARYGQPVSLMPREYREKK
jgi:hypothetical protein